MFFKTEAEAHIYAQSRGLKSHQYSISKTDQGYATVRKL
jgi:hypothetical protein